MASRRTTSSFPPPLIDDEIVGRQTELASLREQLARGERVVCINGPAGVGKSRLARELVKGASARAQAVVVVDLSPTRDRVAALVSIARALETGLESAEPAHCAARFAARLREAGPCLLILDGLDGLRGRDDLAPIVGDIRELAPATSVILISRERVEPRGPCAIELGGLRAPAGVGGEVLA